MNCSEVQDLLSAYHDGELITDTKSNVGEHLGRCSKCAQELAQFERLTMMASALNTPVPPETIWSQLEQQLNHQSVDETSGTKPVAQISRRSFLVPGLVALAATIVVAVGIITYESWFESREHKRFAAEFERYIKEFRRDPRAAQQILLASYGNQLVDPERAVEQVGYRPAIAKGLPTGYTLGATRVIKMPCCTCTQSVCQRNDGSTLAIFEHGDDSCDEEHCCLIELDDQIASSWRRGTRHITLIGVRDDAEVGQMIAWLDKEKQSIPN